MSYFFSSRHLRKQFWFSDIFYLLFPCFSQNNTLFFFSTAEFPHTCCDLFTWSISHRRSHDRVARASGRRVTNSPPSSVEIRVTRPIREGQEKKTSKKTTPKSESAPRISESNGFWHRTLKSRQTEMTTQKIINWTWQKQETNIVLKFPTAIRAVTEFRSENCQNLIPLQQPRLQPAGNEKVEYVIRKKKLITLKTSTFLESHLYYIFILEQKPKTDTSHIQVCYYSHFRLPPSPSLFFH